MHNIYQKIIRFAKKEKRLLLVSFFVLVVFLLNQMIFSSEKITPEDCVAGSCAISKPEKPQLSEEESFFYVDDILQDVPSGYYRLTFQTKADRVEKVTLKLNTYAERNETIDEMRTKTSEEFQNQEVFFFLPEGFDSLLFEKENPEGEGNIFIKNVGIAKLNVDNQKDFATLKKTQVGETDLDFVDASQTQNHSESFTMLQEPKTTLGQIFKAESNYISGVSFNFDIVRDQRTENKQYRVSLWKVRCDEGDCQAFGSAIATKTFLTKSAVEKYRRADGTFRFPLYAVVEKGQDYFVGIDNSKVPVDRKNHLDLKGTRDGAAYPNGSVGMKKAGVVYRIAGDLFFAVHGVNLDLRDGTRILNGARIESLGKGQGKYTYATKGEFLDILDLWQASPGTNFSEENKIIVTEVGENAAQVYEINTIFPIQKMNFFAEQAKASWKRIDVEYSFDRKNWIKAPFSEKTNKESIMDVNADSVDSAEEENAADENAEEDEEEPKKALARIFDFDVAPRQETKTVYFRITPDLADPSKAKYFSLKNLKITADLIIK